MVCDRVAMVDQGRVIATGRLDQLLRRDSCRVRVTGLAPRQRADLSRFAGIDDDGEWITFHGLDAEKVPDLVREIVQLGGRVYAVESRQQTLEDRFLELLGANSS
jgi:ABC-2 type transport system ATP-binding protein